MEISIKGHHIAVTPAISSFIEERISRLQKRLASAIHFTVFLKGKAKNGTMPSIKILVHFAGHQTIMVEEYLTRQVKDFYTIISKAFDTLGVNLEHHSSLASAGRKKARAIVPRNLVAAV